MKKIQYTIEQQQAINTNGDIIVSASAGSGKTTVMIERILRLLLQGVKLEKIFITTFTKASATDMRTKLKEKLLNVLGTTKRLDNTNNDIQRVDINQILDSVDSANIGTFHSVCAKMLRTHFYSCGIDPDFLLIDEIESEQLLAESIANTIDEFNANPHKDYVDLYTVLMSRRTDRQLQELINNIYHFMQAQVNPIEWLAHSIDNIINPSLINSLYQEIKIKSNLSYKDQINKFLIEADKLGMNFKSYAQDLIDIIDGVDSNEKQKSLNKKTCGVNDDNYLSVELYENFKVFKAYMSKQIKEQREKQEQWVDSVKCEPFVRVLMSLVENAKNRYTQKKEDKARLDFNDIEQKMIVLLQDSVARELVQKNIEYIFVDEYQDINPLQDNIISILALKAESFLVGDIKQSIYGFRMCEPRFFASKLLSDDYTKIELNNNFRSDCDILDFVNTVFKDIMTVDSCGVDYKNTAMLIGNKQKHNKNNKPKLKKTSKNILQQPVVLNLIQAKQQKEWKDRQFDAYDIREHDDRYKENDSNKQAEIDATVNHIATLIDKGVDKKDIAVLVRSRGDYAYDLHNALNTSGIDSFVGQKVKLTECTETASIIAYLKVVDLPLSDIDIASVLLSDFYKLQPRDLATISLFYKQYINASNINDATIPTINVSYIDNKASDIDNSFYTACLIYKTNNQDELATVLTEFFNNLELFNNYKLTHTVEQLASFIIARHNYFLIISSFIDGDSMMINLNNYLSSLKADPNNDDLSMYVQGLQIAPVEIEKEVSSGRVQIITVHAAKGLEYDYLIVADTAKSFNKQDLNKKVLLDSQLGFGVKYFDLDNASTHSTVVYECVREKKQEQLIQEEMRLLYVALTRAKKQIAVFLRETTKNLGDKETKTPKSWADWLVRAYRQYEYNIIPYDYNITYKQIKRTHKIYTKKDSNKILDLQDRLSRGEYNHAIKNAPTKITVTRLMLDKKVQDEEVEQSNYSTEFNYSTNKDKNNAFLATNIGTKYHSALFLLDFMLPWEEAYDKIKPTINLDGVNINKLRIAHKNMSELVYNAKHYKERDFVYNDKQTASLLQGKIDLIVIKNNSATLVDYKTSISEEFYPLYSMQLNLYKQAIQSILNIPVKDCLLYDIRNSKFEIV